MPTPDNDRVVEERLEAARLLPRISQEVLSLCKSVDQLLHAQHSSNLAQAIICVQEIARENLAVVVALKWVVLLVDMLEADAPDVRLAACNALASVSVAQEGRDSVRTSGGLRPLVMLLAEGSRSPVAAAAASALMNCSACDLCKEAITDCRGVPMLLSLIRDAVSRCSSSGGSSSGVSVVTGSSANSPAQDLKTPGECKAAIFAAGALMNMGGVISVQEKMLGAGASSVLEAAVRAATPGDVVATRASFMLSWLAVASGEAGAHHADKRGHHHHQSHHQQQPQQRASSGGVSPRPGGLPGLGSTRSTATGSLPPAVTPNQLPRLESNRALGSMSTIPRRATSNTAESKPGTPASKAAVLAGHA